MIASSFQNAITEALSKGTGQRVNVWKAESVGGGCINNGAKLITNVGNFFLKYNDVKRFPRMLDDEAAGLELLSRANAIRIPRVVVSGRFEDTQFLVLDFIETGSPDRKFWISFGEQLAMLHRSTQHKYGLGDSNYIGSLLQRNDECDGWVEFYISQRLEVQLTLALQHQRMSPHSRGAFEKLYAKLSELIPEEQPSLLHGDLWSGNYLAGIKGDPVIIDPAVYYGHREVDLAMTKLFGGFASGFYEAYNLAWPLLPGSEERVLIYQLYPLLVHVNLFGGGYARQVMSIVERFI